MGTDTHELSPHGNGPVDDSGVVAAVLTCTSVLSTCSLANVTIASYKRPFLDAPENWVAS